MSADLSDALAKAATLALEMGSGAADATKLVMDLGEELPVVKPVLKTLKAMHGKVQTVKTNREELAALHQRCNNITAYFIVKCKGNPDSEMDVAPLKSCVEAAEAFAERCSRRGKLSKISRVLKASSEQEEINGLNERIDRLAGDLGMVGVAILERKVDIMKVALEQMSTQQADVQGQLLENQRTMLTHRTHPPTSPLKLAKIPNGTPMRKGWHVERRQVMKALVESLTRDAGPRLVGLVGDSGSGKTTAASDLVRSTEMREVFPDGILWLPVNNGAKHRLPSLMRRLALMLYEDIGDSVGQDPGRCSDGTDYVRQRVKMGHDGRGLKCLVVADDVWEEEVVSELQKTGMWVLLSTRDEKLVTKAQGTPVGVDRLSGVDAESVLRKAAELPLDTRLPDDAADLIELCGHVAMDLAYVGRWSIVRGRASRTAWAMAARTLRSEIDAVRVADTNDDLAHIRLRRRKAILRAGFEDLAAGSDDERVPRLYLSLAVLPDGMSFSWKDAAVLLYDGEASADDEASVQGVVEILERWSVVRPTEWLESSVVRPSEWLGSSTKRRYTMHDAHSRFARENIMHRGNVRRLAVRRWMTHISSLDALRSTGPSSLKRLWLALENVGGDSWATVRPYANALGAMGEDDPLLYATRRALARFQDAQRDWEVAYNMWNQVLDMEKAEHGSESLQVAETMHEMSFCAFETDRADEAGELLRRCLGIQEVLLGQQSLRFTHTLAEFGVYIFTIGHAEEGEELLRRSLAIREAELGLEDMKVAEMLHLLGIFSRKSGKLEEAEELLRRCLEIKEGKLGPKDEHIACTLYQLGVCVRMAGRLEESEELLRQSLDIEEARPGPKDEQVAHTLHSLAMCLHMAGRLEEAEGLFRRCLDIREATLDPQDPCVAYTLDRLGVCIREAGRLGEAEKLLRRCLSIKEAKFGPEDWNVSYTLDQLGVCVREAGRPGEAEKLLRRSLKIKDAKLGPGDIQVAYTLHQLGVCVRLEGRLNEADELLKRCLEIEEAKLGSEDVRVAYTMHELGMWNLEAGRLDEAEKFLRPCLAIKEANLGKETVQVAYTLDQLGVCVREAGQLEEAEELLKRSLAIKESALGSEDVEVACTLDRLSLCVRSAGRQEEAEGLLRRGQAIKEANFVSGR